MKNVSRGVTLIELIVVLTIMSILAVVALPSYQQYLIEARRSDAINAIRSNQMVVEKYMQQNNATPTSGQVTLKTVSDSGFYNMTYTQVSSSTYQIVATAVSTTSQNNDTGCTVITLVSQMDTIYPTYCH
ncbi:MAG TPA: type IV pilin protein [Gammaproteobacteria bacterium]|nr:type IV pilin protein [Gammaproteobacteria bacterium]